VYTHSPIFLIPNFEKIVDEMKTQYKKWLAWTEYLIQRRSTGLKLYSVSQSSHFCQIIPRPISEAKYWSCTSEKYKKRRDQKINSNG